MLIKLYDFNYYLPIRALMRAWLPPARALQVSPDFIVQYEAQPVLYDVDDEYKL